ncbi:MAG: VWA domain-containing protein [Acidobacteria bacterium]|nr:VWA domain-containing protein [Acidobacteriota bacterium]
MNPRATFAALFLLVTGTALTAGQAPAPAPPQPTFKLRVDYVEVDVVVTDKNGNLVRDLKKEDFQVLEDGKGQTITNFTHVDIPVERGDRPLFASEPIEPDVRTNEKPFDGRVYVMVIDDYHTRFGRTQRVKAAAKQFIERRLGANDVMAVVHTAGATTANQEFTSNKKLLLAAVDKTQGRKLDSATANKTNEYYRTRDLRQAGDPLNDPDDAERAFNARSTLDTLRNIAEWFGSVHGRRKAILFVSEGIDYDIYDMIQANNGSNHGGASMVMDASRDAIAAATRSNVAIYGIDPRGLTDLGDESIEIGSYPDDTSLGIGQGSLWNEVRLAQDSLRSLSEETGGFAVVNRNDFSNAFTRIVEDNSSYYVLAYYPPDARPGRVHKIDVRVTRPGLTVRARKGYMTPKKVDAATSAKDIRTPEVRDAIDSPLPVSGLTLHAFTAPFKGAAPNASVLLGVELRGRDLNLSPTDKIQLSYLAIDANGKVKGGNTDAIAMNALKPETKTRIEQTGLRVLNRLDLPPGKYQVRVAAHDSAGGAVGSVLLDLEVPDFLKAPFSISGIVLTAPVAAQLPTVHADEQLRGVLPGPAVAARSFAQNEEVALFAEIYDNQGGTPHKVDITTTVTTDEGKVMFKTDEARDSTDLGGKTGGYGYTTRIPLKDLEVGAYVLTVSAKTRLGNATPVDRQLRLIVTPPVGGR